MVVGKRPRVAPFHDGVRNPTRGALFTVVIEDVRELALARRVQDFVSTLPLMRIHSHVERSRLTERKASACIIQLHRRNPQIEKHSVHELHAALVEDATKLREVGLNEGERRMLDCPCAIHRVRIRIDGDEASRIQAVQDRSRVPARTKRRIDVNPIRPDRQILQRRLQ